LLIQNVFPVGGQCQNREGHICWNVLSWFSCLSVGSNNEFGELMILQ